MELLTSIYFAIGLLVGLWRLSYATEEDSNAMACIGGAVIFALWPLYLIYKWVRRHHDS